MVEIAAATTEVNIEGLTGWVIIDLMGKRDILPKFLILVVLNASCPKSLLCSDFTACL